MISNLDREDLPMNRNQRSNTISSSLLVGVRTFRADAWKRLVHIYGPLVFHWCTKAGVGPQDAEDLGQEVFRAVASKIDRFERKGPRDTFGGWLRTITRHKVADHWRLQSRQPDSISAGEAIESFETPDLSSVVTTSSDVPTGIVYQRALSLIRSEFRESSWKAFWGTAVEGRATADVASDLKMSPMAVRKAKSRVLRRLREEFEGLEDFS